MTTLLQARQQMLAIEPMLGRVEDIAALGAQTITVTVLATGSVQSGKITSKWLLRPQASNAANRAPRLSSDFASSTGIITHAGAAYTDTTATGETVEIHEYEPWRLEIAIQEALQSTRRLDLSYLQGRADGRYSFSDLSWIAQPDDVVKIGIRRSPVLTANRRFDGWGVVSTGGVLQPDRWALAGSDAVFARSTISRVGPYSLSVTRAGADATVAQTIQAVTSGFGAASLRGELVTGVLVCRASTASQVRVRVTSEQADGTVLSTSNSSYHTGGGAWEEVSVEHTVDDAADVIRVQAIVEVDGDVIEDDLYLCTGPVNDAVRRDRYPTDWQRGEWQQNPLAWWGPEESRATIAVKSRRPFPPFDTARVKAGVADLDVTDCEVMLLAYRALAIFFDGLARAQDGNATLIAKAADYAKRADDLGASHLADVDNDQPGARLYSGIAYGRMAQVR